MSEDSKPEPKESEAPDEKSEALDEATLDQVSGGFRAEVVKSHIT
jgi:hypothetical protein